MGLFGNKKPEPQEPQRRVEAGEIGRDILTYGKQSMRELRQDMQRKNSAQRRANL